VSSAKVFVPKGLEPSLTGVQNIGLSPKRKGEHLQNLTYLFPVAPPLLLRVKIVWVLIASIADADTEKYLLQNHTGSGKPIWVVFFSPHPVPTTARVA
jgi:hypothetical protein